MKNKNNKEALGHKRTPHGEAVSQNTNKTERILDGDDAQRIKSDVNGSYTGVPEDGGKPQQDADDL